MGSGLKKLLNALGQYFETVPERLRQKRFIVWTFFIIGTIVVSIGVPRNTIDMSLESWFSKDDPATAALNRFRAQFGGDSSIYLVCKPKDGDLFSEQTLKAVKGIREDLLNFRLNLQEGETSMLEHITRVDSIVSAPALKIKDDALVAGPFIGDNFPLNETDKENLRREALAQKHFPLLYFSKDFQYGAIMVQTDLGAAPVESKSEADEEFGESEDEFSMEIDKTVRSEEISFKHSEMSDYVELMKEVDKIIHKKEYGDRLEYHPVGMPPTMRYFMEQIKELVPLSIAMVLIMVVLLGFLFKSSSLVLWGNMVVLLSCVWTMGASGWMGAVVTNMATLTLLLILAVGIADSVHIMSAYHFFINRNRGHEEALRLSFQKAALPCLLTSVTTIIGMLSITLSSIKHIRTFGYMSALGVGFAFIFTIYLLPLMLDLWSPGPARDSGGKKSIFNPSAWTQKALNKTLPFVEKTRFLVIAFFLAIFIACVCGAWRVNVDSNFVNATKEDSRMRRDYEIADKKMAGTQNMEIYIRAGAENAFQDPIVLKAVDKLQEELRTKYSDTIARSFSLADLAKETHRVLNGGREEYYIIPDDPDVLAQTMFMFGNAAPEDRRRLVSDDYSQSHISLQLYNAGSIAYIKFFEKIRRDIDETFEKLKPAYPLLEVSVTGGLALVMRLADYIAWSQLKSMGFVIFIISLIMIFVFGSVKVGLLSIAPNMIPSILTFGLMGLLGIALDTDTIIIAPVIIGIAVDDTIHFITHYRGEVLKDMNIRRALESAIKEVGQAISFTSLILGLGFFIMSFSSNTSLIKVGIFGSMAIFMALLCDLFLLPALILTFKPKFLTKQEKAVLKNAL